jgi:predicted glycogen debranching enzyme
VPELFVGVPGAAFESKPVWYYNFEYGVEQYRGLDFTEDLFTHGVFKRRLRKGEKLGVIVSTEPVEGRDAFKLLRAEEQRRTKLLELLPVRDPFSETLALAADQFIVKRGEDLKTIIAGYHWFSDWGRDTMIALPGICLVTGRYDEAKKILRAFAQSVSQGMLPNRFPDAGEQPEYNTVDATLWFFVAIHKYLQNTNDETVVRKEFMPVLRDIIGWHDRGTRYNIHVDTDGLLYAGEPGVQLTWMDAKVGNWVVTPRQGKAVEINALWYNALAIYALLADRFGLPEEGFNERATAVKMKFQEIFWNEKVGGLYDYIDGDYRDDAIRPNQIFALSLPFPLLEGSRAESVLQLVEEKLYTPVGLRSLSPDHPAYLFHYGGDQLMRDSAYHQGTVWSWLLGPYVSALVKVRGEQARDHAKTILEAITPHLYEAGIGTISEIFDAAPPELPRGCVAQAWSVGEILRAWVEDVYGGKQQDGNTRALSTRKLRWKTESVGILPS